MVTGRSCPNIRSCCQECIAPPNLEEYPYEPYEFSSMEEVNAIVKIARTISMDSLYLWAKEYVNQYNDQDDYKIKLSRYCSSSIRSSRMS